MRITGLHQKAPKAWKTLPNSDFNRVQFKNESLLEIMHNSDLKHLEFEEFNNKFMLVSIL